MYEDFLSAYQISDETERATKLSELFAADGVDLADLQAKAVTEYKTFNLETGEINDEQLSRVTSIVNLAREVTSRLDDAETAASERAARVADLASFAASISEPDEEVVEETPADVVDETPKVDALVAARTEKPRVQLEMSAMPSKKVVKTEARADFRVFAAADIPGVPAGKEVSELSALADVASRRMDALRRTGGKGRTQNGIAEINRNRKPELTLSSADSLERGYDVVSYATSQSRLKGGSLIAAGGWCAPSETIYDLCNPASIDGLVDIPEITASRGGVRFPAGLDFSSIYAGVGTQTEAQAIAGTVKTCIDVPCPTFTDVRLDISYLCITAPILTNRAYPELIRNFIANALAALAHKTNAIKLAKMVAASEALTLNGTDPGIVPNYGAATTSLEYVAYAASWIRYRHRLGARETLEAVFPLWAKEAFRADLAKKNGVDLFEMTDERIDAYFRARHIRVQWVYDWQDALSSGVATNWGGTPVPATGEWPTTVSGLIYPAGTFFALTSDVITLDGVYDSTGLSTNEYTALFTEEGINVAKQCYTSINLTFPVCVNGLSGAQSAPACSNMPALLTDEVPAGT